MSQDGRMIAFETFSQPELLDFHLLGEFLKYDFLSVGGWL